MMLDIAPENQDPNLPHRRYSKKPKDMPEPLWQQYAASYNHLRQFDPRGTVANPLSSVAVLAGLGIDNCWLKMAFLLYKKPDEDDYPYIPRGCGDMSFLNSAAGGPFR